MARRSVQRLKTVPQHEPVLPREIDFGWLGGTVGLHLRLAQEVAFQAFARRATAADASPWRFAVLFLIDANPGLTQGDLAAAIRRNTSSLTPVLDDLCRLGYVVRERLESDRRAYTLTLTPAGQAALAELMASAVAHERELDRLVGRTNRSELIRTLKRVIAGLEREVGDR
jgi:DNA-binding MarR family transcriptional regulator